MWSSPNTVSNNNKKIETRPLPFPPKHTLTHFKRVRSWRVEEWRKRERKKRHHYYKDKHVEDTFDQTR